jgi:hypothetical protein
MEERFFSPVGEKVRSQKRRKELLDWNIPSTSGGGGDLGIGRCRVRADLEYRKRKEERCE